MAFLAPLAIPLAIAGTAVSTVGAVSSAIASNNAAQYQAKLQAIQGRQAADQAAVKAGEVASNTRQQTAALRGGAIENGFDLGGSMSDLLNQTERQGQLDYLTAVYDGSIEKQGKDASAAMSRAAGRSALTGGLLGAAGTALSGVSSVYGIKRSNIGVSGT